MQDNAPSHASKFTRDYLDKQGFRREKLMTWPPNSPDLNPVEHYWSILKKKLYKEAFFNVDFLWHVIEAAAKTVTHPRYRRSQNPLTTA
ncbi:transposable element tc3 transposase, putative [Perkinsus marinus ATCC 50983]|uniref:Transposable element tc3 transposase, putative n=1 Tax=Perkinsus marinus (strain ATCC 50983 / TXsc) TaxID=423536 RepID=C5LEP2_PERM5|nr:transposable element tc3 transposase, putative [Perkinsus marinus ATCC 50983]EER04860.1 transposable element tc3 transposase, putative [Perkinsus marinus ATCC 50983]|eukprot:XP_002773044.1 transposable element tc3 transposase, putative [Perkinsus marinus ATCC 50983]